MEFFGAFMGMLFMLMGAHSIVDFSLQTNWMAQNKARSSGPMWFYVLSAHALQHGLAVYLITQDLFVGVAEIIAHWLIDFGKCEKLYGMHMDQFLHTLCKVVWVLVVALS